MPGELRAIFSPTVLFSVALMAVIAMMVLPVPPAVVDFGLAASFAIAALVFTNTLFVQRPLEFSSFPSVLVASLILRLSLNVSSTKLIIGEGHTGTDAAGRVIEGFSQFVIQGNIFLGLVIFSVLLIVNFVVITKGAARMAEVGARFALDGMPGKQLAIDSDMAAGAIDHREARERREREQKETSFYGSLDGASKFVKGDAVAGLLITILNLLVGLGVGIFSHGMSAGDAFATYSILTVGDGLVTQIPAVIISVAAALLLARAGGGAPANAELSAQLLGRAPVLGTVAAFMVAFALVPGLPAIPFLLAASGFCVAAIRGRRATNEESSGPEQPAEPVPTRIGDVLDLDEIHIEFAPDLVPMILDPSLGLDARIDGMRNHVASTFGVVLPEIRLTDDPSLQNGAYVIRIHGVEKGRSVLRPNCILALSKDPDAQLPDGLDVKEPVYGAPARWVDDGARDEIVLRGVTTVLPQEVLATHLLEVIKSNFSKLVTLKGLRRLLEELTSLSNAERAAANRKLIEDIVPEKISYELLLQVMRLLLDERVSVRNMTLILETLAEVRSTANSPETMCELVRQRLGEQIAASVRREDGRIPLIQLDPAWEQLFERHADVGALGDITVALPPSEFNRLADALASTAKDLGERGLTAAFVVPAVRRRFLALVCATKRIDIPVLSFEELGAKADPVLVAEVAA